MAVQRRLGAIVAADVAGDPRLMAGMRRAHSPRSPLTAHLKELIEPCIVVRRAVAFQESMPCDSRTASAQTRIIEAFSNRHEGSPRIVRREANARERHNLFHGLLWILVMPALSGSRKNQRRPLPPFAQHVDEKIAKRKHMRGSVLFIGNCQNPKHEVHLLSTQPR